MCRAVEVTQRTTVTAPIEEVWRVVSNLPLILPCVPGAECGERRGDGQYNATITVSAGEFSVSFAGIASVEVVGETVAVFRASGSDRLRTISAEAEARVRLEAIDDARTSVDVVSTFDFSGFLAPAARAGGGPAARVLMRKFTTNLARKFRD